LNKNARVALVTGTERTRKFLFQQLEEIIGDLVQVDSYALDEMEDKSPGQVKADLVVVSSKVLLEEDGFKVVSPEAPLIVARRIINYNFIDQILTLPEGTKALLVNDVRRAVFQSINSLKKLGLDHIEYIPYLGEEIDEDVKVAITPGEVEFVPEFVEKVINIGPRLIDLTTIFEIIKQLNLPQEKAEHLSEKYLKKIIQLSQKLALSSQRAVDLNHHLRRVLDGVKEGILAVDNKGIVSVFNENLFALLKIPGKKVVNRKVDDVIKDKKLLYFIRNGEDTAQELFTFGGEELLVTRFFFQAESTVVCTFKNVKEDWQVEKQLRQELVKKGYVGKYCLDDILGSSPEIERAKNIAEKIAKTDLSILIEGESGTGKELFASAMHNLSPRRKGPFLAVNFSSLSEDLVESELFGYDEGAFTGAAKGGKEGLFEQAEGGTIFLDEIGDISLKIQARLLRVLEEKEIMRVGGNKIIPVNVRVIAATNKDLTELIEKGQFREDLYHRIKVMFLHIPPLRQRVRDLDELVNYFLKVEGGPDLSIHPEVIKKLKEFNWYGNIRELKNTISYMLAVCEDKTIRFEDIPDDLFFEKGKEFEGEKKDKNIIEEWIATGEWEIYGNILRMISEKIRNGERIGRKIIAEEVSRKLDREFTEQQVRLRLNKLESQGLIIKKRGRGGTTITPLGKKMLDKSKL